MHARFTSRHALSTPAVSARNLTKSFARGLARSPTRVTALDAVCLDVHGGEIVGIVGSAGAGKTTLLQCLCGLLRADSGAARCPRRTAYVAAVPVFYPFLTPRDVLELSIARRATGPLRPGAVERTLRELGLDDVERSRIAELPWEAQNRIAVAEALVLEPRVMLVDSNAAHPVLPFEAVTLRALAAYADAGAAIVLAARAASAVGSVATRVVLMEKGRTRSTPGRFVAERVH